MRHLGLMAIALACALPAAGTAAAQEPPCLTYIASDGNEPPCNPALADSAWSASHRGSYAQASSPFPGPVAGAPITHAHTDLGAVPIVIDFSAPYADGGRVAWMSTVGAPDNGQIFKLDLATGNTIDSYSLPADEGRGPSSAGSVSGAYNLLDRDGRLIVGRAQALEIYGDATPGERGSPIALLKRFTLPAAALCRPTDKLVGINMLPDGHVAFATDQGVVGVVPRRPELMDAEHVRVLSINGERCTDAALDDAALENVSNSIAVDETGAIYTVTDTAQYKHRLAGDRIEQVWRARYETGAGGGVRLGDGSGSTPSLMGTDARDDRFVVITDGQKLMHLVLMWRDEIPAGWTPIAPGKDRRIACEIPVRFGDPAATETVDEQSVLVRGYASVLVNNALRDSAALDALPGQARTVAAALAGGDPSRAPYGIERIDWDPGTRTCATRWVNRELSLPNGIPSMSSATGLMYGIGQRAGTWGLEGIDFATGTSKLWAPSSSSPTENSFYAATEVGPDGAIWTGTFGGVSTYRGPVAPAPGRACKDITAPVVAIGPARRGRRTLTLTGRAADRACGVPATAPRVDVAMARRVSGGRCRFVTRDGRLTAARACTRPLYLRVSQAGGRWRLRVRLARPGRRYELRVRATDSAGNPAETRKRIAGTRRIARQA